MNWSLSHIATLAATGKVRGYTVISKKGENGGIKPVGGKAGKKPLGMQTAAIDFFIQELTKRDIPYVQEYRFLKTRRFRFDVAVPSLMLALEYEGLTGKGQVGGHQTKSGYAANCTKYNAAAIDGWTVLRYTARTYKDFNNDIVHFLMKVK